MSKALICDKCKTAFSEQNATHIDMKCGPITTHLDFCPKCGKEFRDFVWVKKDGDGNA